MKLGVCFVYVYLIESYDENLVLFEEKGIDGTVCTTTTTMDVVVLRYRRGKKNGKKKTFKYKER